MVQSFTMKFDVPDNITQEEIAAYAIDAISVLSREKEVKVRIVDVMAPEIVVKDGKGVKIKDNIALPPDEIPTQIIP